MHIPLHPSVKRLEFSTQSFSPRALIVYYFDGLCHPRVYKYPERYVYDYEFELITESEGSQWIGDKHYPIKKGDVIFRRPGQYTQGIPPYSGYTVIFDLLGNSGKPEKIYNVYWNQPFQISVVNPVLDSIPPVYRPDDYSGYHTVFNEILYDYQSGSENSVLGIKCSLIKLINSIYKDLNNPFSKSLVPSSPYYSIIKEVIDYIRNNLDGDTSLERLSGISHLSPNHFHKIFSETIKTTPANYVAGLRLDRARNLLIKSSLTIEEIASMCGFKNVYYFNSFIKNHLGMPPGQFRKTYRISL